MNQDRKETYITPAAFVDELTARGFPTTLERVMTGIKHHYIPSFYWEPSDKHYIRKSLIEEILKHRD